MLPHPFACLDAIETGVLKGSGQGLLKEQENFARIIGTPSAKGLVHTFLASKACAKVPGLPKKGSRIETVISVIRVV